ncbi:sensor histidine kinase [Gorillibacterium sp. sgz500922]|uniref:sensor histidine kinase n=1 Tax=Gorillibacterium sp. sgz500922 TaxID=3446694 RepID=UPI003F670972
MLNNAPFRKTLFVRLVIVHLLVILPVLLLGIYLYNWSYGNANHNLSKTTMVQLADYLGDLNREIDWMELQQFDILEDGDLNKLAVAWEMTDNVERRASLNRLVHRLTTIKSSNAYVKDIVVYIRPIRKSVSAAAAVNDFDSESFRFFSALNETGGSRLIRYRDALHLSAFKRSGVKDEPPLYVVQIELDTQMLRDSLHQIDVYPESRSILTERRSGFFLGSDAETERMLEAYADRFKGTDNRSFVLEMDSRTYSIDTAFSESIGLTVSTCLPEGLVRKPLRWFNLWAWLFTASTIGAIILYSYSTYRLVHKPLLLLIRSFRRMEEGTLDIPIKHDQTDEFGYLYTRFNHMLGKLQALIDQDFKQKLMMQKAELKQLQSQINPHFLYNSFFILNSLAKVGDVDRIEQFTNMLGEYFRFITRNGEDQVRLGEEIRHSRMYTEIQKLRFSRRITVQFDELPKEMEDLLVPRLIIQPIIENAYEHSLEKMAEEGHLRITFEQDACEVRIVVEDNGNMADDATLEALRDRLTNPSPSQEITGLINIHKRIALVYGEPSGLVLSRSELGGMKVTVRIGREAWTDRELPEKTGSGGRAGEAEGGVDA